MSKTRVIYYNDELNDEFSTASINAKTIDSSYRYPNSVGRSIIKLLVYWIILHPIAFIYMAVIKGHRVKNKKAISRYKGGFFIYGNHTNPVPDAFIPSMLTFPRSAYVIVHSDNVSMPVLGKVTPACGAIPLPSDMKATKNFTKQLEHHAKKGDRVFIYPEAHIWPYYTKIRPYKDVSFAYPIKFETASFCFTNTYQKRLIFKSPKMVTYIDGPFYPPKEGSLSERRKALRDEIYNVMCERSKNSNVEYVKYIKREEN